MDFRVGNESADYWKFRLGKTLGEICNQRFALP
jgi:hypothetical protein